MCKGWARSAAEQSSAIARPKPLLAVCTDQTTRIFTLGAIVMHACATYLHKRSAKCLSHELRLLAGSLDGPSAFTQYTKLASDISSELTGSSLFRERSDILYTYSALSARSLKVLVLLSKSKSITNVHGMLARPFVTVPSWVPTSVIKIGRSLNWKKVDKSFAARRLESPHLKKISWKSIFFSVPPMCSSSFSGDFSSFQNSGSLHKYKRFCFLGLTITSKTQ